MGAEQKNRNAILSRLVADLSVNAKDGGGLSSKISRLRGELAKVIEHESTVFGKFRGLVESLREVIPGEQQRYQAAVKAMSATSKLSRQEIVEALNGQLSELKILEKGLLSALPGWRDELRAMEARSREVRDEIARLRDTIARLESEEQGLLSGIAAREKESESVEKAVGELFADIGAEITAVKRRVEELAAESERTAPQPLAAGASFQNAVPGARKDDTLASSSPQGSASQKKCPMCGGRMDFHYDTKMWMCYTCAYEERGEEQEAGGRNEEILPSSAPHQEQDTEWQKKCPMCGGQMNYHSQEETWLCYTCAHEEKGGPANEPPGPSAAAEPDAEPSPSIAVPLGDIFPDEYLESKKQSSASSRQQTTKKKPCPVCHKKMGWHELEKAWRCPFCQYERRI